MKTHERLYQGLQYNRPQLLASKIEQRFNCKVVALTSPLTVEVTGVEHPHRVRTLTIDGFLPGDSFVKKVYRPRESFSDEQLFELWLDSLQKVFNKNQLLMFGLPTIFTYELPMIHPMTYESALVETEDHEKKVFSISEVDRIEMCDVLGRIWFDGIEECL